MGIQYGAAEWVAYPQWAEPSWIPPLHPRGSEDRYVLLLAEVGLASDPYGEDRYCPGGRVPPVGCIGSRVRLRDRNQIVRLRT